MKDLHIHLISISMLEKLLEDSPIKVDECKLYCTSVKEFDILEGYLYEAKMWWKAGNYEKAKEIVHSKLQYTRVKMKAYFLLVDFLEAEGKTEEILNLSKEMVKKCRSHMIPVQVWIEANMIYAKCLIQQNNIHEAILVYKSLAQVQPIPFIPDLSYTRELQKVCNKEELDNVLLKLFRKDDKDSYLLSDSTDFQIQRSKLVCSRLFVASALLGEDDEEITSESSKTISESKSDNDLIGSRLPEPLPPGKISILPCGKSANIGFAVTTSYKFLYKIGKTCAKYTVNHEEGLCALHDFLNIHHYWTRDGIEVHEELKVKAKFWLGILYHQTNQHKLVEEVFKDILSMLFQLGRTKMSDEVLKILNANKE